MLICVPMIGCVFDLDIDSENSRAPHKLFESHKPAALILFKLKRKDRLIIFATHNRYFANMADCKLELFSGRIRFTNARNKKKF